jgi:hypothetical protein
LSYFNPLFTHYSTHGKNFQANNFKGGWRRTKGLEKFSLDLRPQLYYNSYSISKKGIAMEQHLIHVLRNGYTKFNQDGTQELVPPNKYMLRAAKEIESLLNEVNSMRGNYALLMAERDSLIKEKDELTQAPSASSESNGEDRREQSN